ncbi:MAG: alkaline phosphatase family protein [Thermoleophilaceae bacterium]
MLAIALESAEWTLVQRLMEAGEMPNLGALAERSAKLTVAPQRYIGGVPLWPSFTSGLEPEEHRRLYGPWLWDPHQMRVAPQQFEPLMPLWSRAGAGSVGLFDMPGVPETSAAAAFIIRGWGSHNPMEREYTVFPSDAASLLAERHPFRCGTEINYVSGDRVAELSRVGTDAIRGLRLRGAAAVRLLRRLRPEVAMIDFPEFHRSGHWLWHTLEPGDPLYESIPDAARSLPVGIADVYREADRQVGLLVEEAGPDAEVFVFSLNGMEPAHGIPDFLRSVLLGTGYARIAKLRTRSLPGRGFRWVKARTPARVKRAYHGAASEKLLLRAAQLLPDYDWAATRAFAIPSEQHGWIRLNVEGREVAGIVPAGEYDATCEGIEAMLRSLVSAAGEPLVKQVVRTGKDNVLPDLAVHWTPAAHGEVARLDGREFRAPRILPWLVGQHTVEGFCLAPERVAEERRTVAPAELQELMLAPVGVAA